MGRGKAAAAAVAEEDAEPSAESACSGEDDGGDGSSSAPKVSSSSSSSSSSPSSRDDSDGATKEPGSSTQASGNGTGGGSGGQGPVLGDTTVMWHGFKWCQVKSSKQSGSEHTGWEVKCCCTTHQHMGQLVCRKHMSFRKLRGRDITERMLMWWCLHASDVVTAVDHRDLILRKAEVLPFREEW